MSSPYPKPSNTTAANYGFLMVPRFGLFWLFVALSLIGLIFQIWWLLLISLAFVALGVHDMKQKTPCHFAKLSDWRTHSLFAGKFPPRNSPIFLGR